MIKAYCRVSTIHQDNGERQLFVFEQNGIKIDKVYFDKLSGKNTDRPQLKALLDEATEGDIVYCESISRLGRNLKDLIEIIDQLVAKGVTVKIIKEGIDTSTSTYKLLLAIFGGVAEMERETTNERVNTKIAQLKEDKANGEINTKTGEWFGRPKTTKETLPKNFKKYYNQMIDGTITKAEMGRLLGVSRQCVYKWIKIYEG